MTLAHSPITEVELKRCPRCPEQGRLEWHRVGDFGVCKARPDGMNLYCRVCIREKIYASRVARREYLKARQAAGGKVPAAVQRKANMRAAKDERWVRRVKDKSERVLRALEAGARTQGQIKHLTLLSVDEVSDVLADLLFPPDDVPRIRIELLSAAEESWDSENWSYYKIAA